MSDLKGIDEYTKEELYCELKAKTIEAECLRNEVKDLIKLTEMLTKRKSGARADVKLNL